MRTNVAVKSAPIHTHEGAVATHINPDMQLRRLTLATMLFEDQFYVDGKTIAEAIREALAIEPERAVTYENMADAYENLGRVSEALQAYQEALRLVRDRSPELRRQLEQEIIRLEGQ